MLPLQCITALRGSLKKFTTLSVGNSVPHLFETSIITESSKWHRLIFSPYEKRALMHTGSSGKAKMVNISEKTSTRRVAVATASVCLSGKVIQLIAENKIAKGDVLGVSQLAGIMAAKKTSDLIPLCHNITVACVKVWHVIDKDECIVTFTGEVHCVGQTGAEMEALTAVSVAALTLYDMCKAHSHDIKIMNIVLQEKTGGKNTLFNVTSEN